MDVAVVAHRGPVRRAVTRGRALYAAYQLHRGGQFAAAIAYRAVFALVPFVALFVSVVDLLLPVETRQRIVDWVFTAVPGYDLEASVERSLVQSGSTAQVVGVVSLLTLLWTASALVGSIRAALCVVWESDRRDPFLRGKLLDFALVGSAGVLLVVAFGLSLVGQVVVEAGQDVAVALGWNGDIAFAHGAAQLGTGIVATFLAFAVLYRVATPVRLRPRELWKPSLLAAVAFQLVMSGFALYLAHVADFSAIYGPIGAVLAFLVLVYALAIVVLLAAEVAAGAARAAADPRP